VARGQGTRGGCARASAAAELACRAAKDRGRNRVELDDANDMSLVARHRDVLAVGMLREALKSNQFLVYAQKIVPLHDTERPSGYELLLRLKTADGSVASYGDYIRAAQRYQLLVQVDRWMAEHELAILGPSATRLHRLNITISVKRTA